MASTKIEWAQKSWNVISGCSKISEGCRSCYAERMANRLKGRYGYPADEPFRVTFHPERLDEPKHWRKPCRVFVCSMSDLFHESVSDIWIDQVIETITCDFTGAPQHTYLLLTKRPERILKSGNADRFAKWPNVWLGVTAENQQRADERIPILLQIPAAVRFVSIEPMLGPVTIYREWRGMGHEHHGQADDSQICCCGSPRQYHDRIDWVICGGETGPGARPMHPDWVRSLRDQCVSAGIPYFFKGWGEWAGLYSYPLGSGVLKENGGFIDLDKKTKPFGENGPIAWKVGKKKAGRLLDGRTWDEFPEDQR